MAALVLALGMVNLAVGIALALLVQSPFFREHLPGRLDGWFRRDRPSNAVTVVTVARVADQATSVPTIPQDRPAIASSFPSHWKDDCAPEGLTVTAFEEALLWLVSAKLTEYRTHLLAFDSAHRAGSDVSVSLAAVRSASEDWQQKLSTWVAEVAACPKWCAAASLEPSLDELLRNHSFQIKSVMDALAALEKPPGGTSKGSEARPQILRAFDAVNALRDRTQVALIEMLRADDRLERLPASIQTNESSATLSRMGLESTWREWFLANCERTLLVSAVLLDVDRTAKLNDCFGLQEVDDALAAFGSLLKAQVRQQRGFDRIVRFTGQSFLLFLGDTSGREAVSVAERVRRTVEALSFRSGEQHLSLTASCGVVELEAMEPLADFLARVVKMTAEAKRAGRNRTVLEENQRPQLVELPHFIPKSTVLEVAPPASNPAAN